MANIRLVIVVDTQLTADDLKRKMSIIAGKMGDVSEVSHTFVNEDRFKNSDKVLLYLRRCREKGDFYRTQAQIGRAVGLGASAVHRALKKLRFQVETDGNRGWRAIKP